MDQAALPLDRGHEPGERSEAMERAGRLLTLRPRTVAEIRSRLDEAGFANETVEATVARLHELGLLDDLAFARQWVEERSDRKGLGPRALEAELARKGVDRDTIEEALRASGLEEGTAARAAAEKQLRKVVRYPLKEQGGRLMQALLRRGFSHEAAEEAARAVLPPEGWD